MLIGRIAKQEGSLWSAEVSAIGAFTQGTSRTDAASMLAEVIELMIGRSGFKVTVTEVGEDNGAIVVLVDATEPIFVADRCSVSNDRRRARTSGAPRRQTSEPVRGTAIA